MGQAPTEVPSEDTTFKRMMKNVSKSLDKRDFEMTITRLNEAENYADATPSLPQVQQLDIPYFRTRTYLFQGKYKQAIPGLKALAEKIDDYDLEGKTSFYTSAIWNMLGAIYNRLDQADSALFFYQKALDATLLESEKRQQKMIPNIETNIGNVYLGTGEINKAIKHYSIAKEGRLQQEKVDSFNLANTIQNIGIAYGYKGDVERNIACMEEALAIKEALLPRHNFQLARPYLNLAVAYTKVGLHEKANRLYEEVYLASEGIEHTYEKNIYIFLRLNHANYVKLKKDVETARKLLIEALVYSKRVFGNTHRNTATCYTYLGNAYRDESIYTAADSCYQHALDIYDQNSASSYVRKADLLRSLAYIQYKQEKYQEALPLFKQADSLYHKASGPFSHFRGDIFDMIGRTWSKMGHCQQANVNFREALNILYQSALNDISLLAETPCLDKRETLSVLLSYAENLQSCFPKEPDSLIKAKTILAEYNEMLAQYRDEFKEEEDFASLSEKSSYFNHLLLDNLSLRQASDLTSTDQLNEAFEDIEQNTHIFLHRSIQTQSSQAFSTLPSDLLELERSIKVELSYLEKSLQDEQKEETPDSLGIAEIRDQLFIFQKRSDSLQQQIQDQYPSYYQLKYSTSVVDIKDLQNALPSNTALLRYILGASQNYVFVIQKNSSQLVTLPNFDLERIRHFRKSMISPFAKSDQENSPVYYDSLYRATAYALYQKLVEPIQLKSDQQLPERLIIIPDGELHYLPFGTLLTNPSPKAALPQSYPYLVKKHAISYAFSATSYGYQVRAKRPKNEQKVLAFAPEFDGESFDETALFASQMRSQLVPLAHNQREVQQIGQMMNASLFTGELANRKQFMASAPNHNILHIASHAMLNDENHQFSYIAFSPDSAGEPPSLLYLADLYGLELQADLVVLSACNTAQGKLMSGEGVASLSQGFAYAGARSLITTLWSVDDKATAQLMGYFYEGLAENLPKDIALQQAKLRLLEEENLPPFYWGAAIAVGDMRPLQTSKSWLWGIASLIVLIVGFAYWRRKKN